MKKARIIVFALLALAVAAPLAPAHDPAPPPVAAVAGNGILGALACAGCLGSGMALMTFGWGSLWAAAMSAGDGALAEACVGACASAF